jgi:hypothetical protein
LGCAGAYWANLLISSITQSEGDSSGHLFDTKDFNSLATQAVIQQVLKWMEKQIEFGVTGGTFAKLCAVAVHSIRLNFRR